MIAKPTLVIHTTHFDASSSGSKERDEAVRLGEDLYELLTRPRALPLAWGPGIPVRIATAASHVDLDEGTRVFVVPVLGSRAFVDAETRAIPAIQSWARRDGVTVVPLPIVAGWRAHDTVIPQPIRSPELPSTDTNHRIVNEILLALARLLSGTDAYASRLFISHAKSDLLPTNNAANRIREYVKSETTGTLFFDEVSLLPGEPLVGQLSHAASTGVFVAVRGDHYSSRSWCRKELLAAKQAHLPTLTVEVLSTGETRSAAYAGNGPTLVWQRDAENAAARVLTLAMVEAVRHLHFQLEGKRIIEAADLPSSAICLSRPPELLDLAALRARADTALVALHPDPPLPAFERTLLQEADKRLRPVTPTTAFAGGIGSARRAPLDGWRVALSVSHTLEPEETSALDGLTADHLTDAVMFLGRALVGVGSAIAYGGVLGHPRGFTEPLAHLIVTYNETARQPAELLHSYLAATLDPDADRDLSFKVHSMRDRPDARLPVPRRGEIPSAARTALYFSDVRRVMAEETRARVMIGGATAPRSATSAGFGGSYPGVVEEAWWTSKLDKPLYVAGGFGGASEQVAQLFENTPLTTPLDDEAWKAIPEWRAIAAALATDAEREALGLPATVSKLADDLRTAGRSRLASDEASIAWNGLTVAENKMLFRARDPLVIAALVLKGMIALSTQQAQGKLRVELNENDVTTATDLEVLAFGAFSDVPIGGAGSALDRVSGGAAAAAHQTGTPVASRSRSLGADFLYAVDLGPVTTAVGTIARSAERAAEDVANMVRRHGFARVGIVTFFGAVAAELGEVTTAMVRGLSRIRDTAELIWFERDPVRAALLASIFEAHPEVELTRRAATIVADVAPPSRKRAVMAIRRDTDALEVALLLNDANGMAPRLRPQLTEQARLALAGKTMDAAPRKAELARRGAKLASLLLGDDADLALKALGASELSIMHDAACGGIPFEAIAWELEGRRVTPATEQGLVRHLLVDGLSAARAMPRPPRAGRLGILVVIDPREDLPGAAIEGDALVKQLKRQLFTVTELRGAQATVEAVRAHLSDPSIDVLHYCGHAFFVAPGPDGSGLLLANDERLTLRELTSVKTMPRLAFVNACQAARVRGDAMPGHDAEAFAELFLRAGVNAYLGTFWLVSDDGAATFARKVYEALARGADLGTAVIEGRRALQEEDNSDWANYVLYGDAGFRLVNPLHATEAPEETALPEPTGRLEDKTIVASWVMPADEAPRELTAAVLDRASRTPLPLSAPASVDRREGTVGSRPTVTWILTATLADAPAADVLVIASAGSPATIPVSRAASVRGQHLQRAAQDEPELRALRTLLDQQPDQGHAILRAMQPSADPTELRARIDHAIDGPGTRAIWPFQERSPVEVDQAALDAFVAAYRLPPISVDDARSQTFQTREDWKSYVVAPGAIAFTLGLEVNEPMWRKEKDHRSLTYDVRPSELRAGGIEVALFADNGNGLHASRAIAKQITASNLPYAFHLGDVYYGGGEEELARFFEKPLEEMFDRTELFMISGNHEMFAKGEWFQSLIRRKNEEHPHQRQRGEVFRVRGPGFQILGVDTMYAGWNAGRLRHHDRPDQEMLELLDGWLREGADGINVLLTTNEPWGLGSTQMKPLYESLRATIAGRVDLWFWGNVHYAALFDPWAFDSAVARPRSVVGSCIGHGGYPFYTMNEVGRLPPGVACRWLETKSRYWPDATLRPDVGANGWCRMSLVRDEEAETWNVTLRFVDWVGRDRLSASLHRKDGASIVVDGVQTSDAQTVGGALTWRDV